VLPGCQWHTRPEGVETAVLVCCAMHGVKAHLEHALLPEGFNLRVRLVVCQPYATPGGSRLWFASARLAGEIPARTPLTIERQKNRQMSGMRLKKVSSPISEYSTRA